jgi:hypothetical protein
LFFAVLIHVFIELRLKRPFTANIVLLLSCSFSDVLRLRRLRRLAAYNTLCVAAAERNKDKERRRKA